MLITENSLACAVRTFVANARIPQPESWNLKMDERFIVNNLFPAMLAALSEIETVEPCFGFDITEAAQAYCRGEDLP